MLTSKNNNLMNSDFRQPAAWIALLAIAWLQLSLAVHQFDHVAEYVEGSCGVCVQLDRVDAVLGHAADGQQLPEFGLPDFDTPELSASRGAIHGFNSRAPPLI